MSDNEQRVVDLKNLVVETLDENKGIEIIDIDLRTKSAIADYMVVATGTSSRHVASLAQKVMEEAGKKFPDRKQRVEGLSEGDWVLVDLQDVILHVFRPEVRDFYSIEKMWSSSTIGVEHKQMVSKKSASETE